MDPFPSLSLHALLVLSRLSLCARAVISQPEGHDPLWDLNNIFIGSHITYPAYQVFALWFITVAKPHLWSINKNNFKNGDYHSMKNCTLKGCHRIREVDNYWSTGILASELWSCLSRLLWRLFPKDLYTMFSFKAFTVLLIILSGTNNVSYSLTMSACPSVGSIMSLHCFSRETVRTMWDIVILSWNSNTAQDTAVTEQVLE